MSETKFLKNTWLFFLGRALFRLFFSTFGRWKVSGRENIPPTGGVLIAPNHRSMADPPLAGAAMRRPLFFMAKQELFEVPVLGFLIRRTNAFPVRRGEGDVGAFRNTQRLLEEGEAVLVFPEGGRSKDGNFRPAKAGAGMLACLAQVPVVPMRIKNSDRIGKAPVEVIFGKPLYPPKEYTKATYQQFSNQILEAVKALG
jgi:1-acyl-sn-glycerol-3-phosphate acyltransferase